MNNLNTISLLTLLTMLFIILPNSMAEMLPSLTANGSKTSKTLIVSEPLTLKVSLLTDQVSQRSVDWWLYANTDFGTYSYVVTEHGNLWQTGLHRAISTAPFTFSDYEALNTDTLPAGNYILRFAVDDNNDGVNDSHHQTNLNVTIGNDSDLRCTIPNPRRLQISNNQDYWNVLSNGDFEQNDNDVELQAKEQSNLQIFSGQLSNESAHSGVQSYKITASANQGGYFWIKTKIDKGKDNRYSLWIRSAEGESTITPRIDYKNSSGQDSGESEKLDPVNINNQWQQLSYTANTSQGVQEAWFGFEVEPNTSFYIDDTEIAIPIWSKPNYSDDMSTLTVGGITVPQKVTPTLISFLIHIEDPSILQTNEEYFFKKSAVFEALAQMFHKHGGFLTIQPEEDWIKGAVDQAYSPTLLKDLATNYNVKYSTHTHGPNCVDPDGVPRSASDCSVNPSWTTQVSDDQVITYIKNLKTLIASAAQVEVTDHNGNFDYEHANRFNEIPMSTWSAYKNKYTQSSYDYIINNPWRPKEGNALTDVDQFLTHASSNSMIYVPGAGAALSTHHERIQKLMEPIVSQFVYYADENRINTLYFVMHIDKFFSLTGDDNYVSFNPITKQTTLSDELQQHINYWDTMLTELIDPLVEKGYLQWASIAQMGEQYNQWEQQNCP